ncbi:MAG: hypothetical protein Q9165_004985 [Trypethelium subeluteriae]
MAGPKTNKGSQTDTPTADTRPPVALASNSVTISTNIHYTSLPELGTLIVSGPVVIKHKTSNEPTDATVPEDMAGSSTAAREDLQPEPSSGGSAWQEVRFGLRFLCFFCLSYFLVQMMQFLVRETQGDKEAMKRALMGPAGGSFAIISILIGTLFGEPGLGLILGIGLFLGLGSE